MTCVGCDLHTCPQQGAVFDTGTAEVSERQLAHEGTAIEEFYAALPRTVIVGIESTGYAVWCHTRDALHILDLLRLGGERRGDHS